MFRIGDFSRIARVSCRLLRYYDHIGLLPPALTDRDSGYRHYSAAQLPRLNRILVLKELGLSLDEIARVIDGNPPAAELRDMLERQRGGLMRQLQEEESRLRHIETRLLQIETEDDPWGDDILMRPEPARKLLSVRRLVPSFAEAKQVLREVWSAVTSQVAANRLGNLVVVAHPEQFEPDSLDVELGFLLDGEVEAEIAAANGVMSVRELPEEAAVATCVRSGPPEEAHLATARIGRFIEANGYQLAGPNREVFLETPRFEHMAESVVEMQFPVRALGK